jgi:hypothetical protein
LVAEALTGAGRHDEEYVAAVGGGAADGFLIGAECGEAEGSAEKSFEIHAKGAAELVSHVLPRGGGDQESG